MAYRFLIAVLLLAVAACRDAPTAVNGPSPPTPQSPSGGNPLGPGSNLLSDSLTVLIARQLRIHPAAPRDQVMLLDAGVPLDSTDIVILQATFELIQQMADSLAADTASAGQ